MVTWVAVWLLAAGNCLAATTDYTHYLMAYFTGNSIAQEQIRYAVSTDGTSFGALNGGEPIVAGSTIANTGAVRDPYITRGHDGDAYPYYMVCTDMTSTGGWTNKGLVILRSKDLINWEHHAFDFSTYFSDLSDVTKVWAPEIIWDTTAQKYLIYYALQSSSKTGGILKIYYSYISDDFSSLTAPTLLYCYNSSATIDADIVEHNGTYYMFFKSEASEKRIRMTSSTSLTDWSNATESVLVGQIDEAQEGPCVYQLIGQDKWILMYDLYGRSTGTFHQCTTTDFSTFTAQGYLTGISPRHGAVVWLTDEETTRLQTWSKLNILLRSLGSDLSSSTEAEAAKTAIAGGETTAMQTAYDALQTKINENYTDVTSTYLSNCDFETSPTFDGTSTGTSGSVNATPTTGSTLTNSSCANVYNINDWTSRASSTMGDYARTFTMPYNTTIYVKSNNINGGQAVTSPTNGSSVTSNNKYLLFVQGSWCDNTWLGMYREVTLPAGSYKFSCDLYVGTTLSNATGECYVQFGNVTKYIWPTTLNTWTPGSVSFTLNQPTKVKVSIGYKKTANKGAGESPFLFADNLKLLQKPVTEQPSPTDPIDMTNDVSTAKADWTGATGNYTAATPNNLVEHYGNSAWTGNAGYQTLSGFLAPGLYDVSLYCDASQAWISTPAVTDGATGYTSAYANTATQDVPVYNRTAVTTADFVTVSNAEVTDGTLKMGVTNNQAGANWIIWQIKSLIYKGPKVDTEAYNNALSEAQQLYAAGTTSSTIRAALKAAIADTPTADNAYSYAEKTAALVSAVNAAKSSAETEVTGSNNYTELIINPDIASTTGWTIAHGSGNHDTTSGDPAVKGDTTPYLDSWAATWATQYNATQTVSGLPDGIYRMTATVRSNITNGVSISATSGTNTATATYSTVTSWQTISLICTVKGGSLTISVDSHLSNGGWFSADDFTLTYMGGDAADNAPQGTDFKISANGLTEPQAEAALTTLAANKARTVYLDETVFDSSVTDGAVDNVTSNANLLVINSQKSFNHAIHVNNGQLADGSVLTDGCPFFAPANYTGSLSYTRKISGVSGAEANFGTLILPVPAVETSDTKLYIPTSLSGTTLIFTETNPLPANTPGLYRTTSATSVPLTGTNICATPASLASTYMVGLYEPLTAIPTGDYVLSKNKFYYVDATVSLSPFRTYIVTPANAVRQLNFSVDGGATTVSSADALETTPLIVLGEQGGMVLKANSDVTANVFTTAGKLMGTFRMDKGTEQNVPLPAGIYLVNGLKVIVK
jgi:hypothetical protein